MDHLPLPENPVIRTLPIPFLCKEPYDGGPFLTYPDRTGWNVVEGQWPQSLSRHGREVGDEAEIGAFIQTWLYFGLLHEVIGKNVDPAGFKAPGCAGSTPYFSSKHLVDIATEWAIDVEAIDVLFNDLSDVALALESTKPGEYLVRTWLRAHQKTLNTAKAISMSIMEVDKTKSSTTLQLVLLAVAALGDYLNFLLVGVAHGRGVEENSRTLWEPQELDLQPLFSQMRGWCPNRLHSFSNDPTCTLEVLWYLANLVPPKVHDDHRSCVSERCNSLHIDQHNYRVQHIRENCNCAFIGPSMEDMVGKVQRGSIALFNVQDSATEIKVTLQDENETPHYIAISHVWADGHGNPESNSLPACVLRKLQKEVDALGLSQSPSSHTSIWMDTISLPRYPLDLRRKAVLRLSDVFTRATGVLVQDSYLCTMDSADMPLIEVLARISITGWTSRLWTFSEGQLAQRIWFQFRDTAIDLLDLYRRGLQESIASIPAMRLTTITEEMEMFYSATTLRRHKEEHAHLFGQLKAALSSRQTSWPSDEALCLGAILNINLSRIVDADDDKKMAVFWRQVHDVPTDLIFLDNISRLEDTGCRWAPATMLTGANPDLRLLSTRSSHAQPTRNGLEFTIAANLRLCVVRPCSTEARKLDSSRRHFINFYCQLPMSTGRETLLLKDKSGTWWTWSSAFLLKDESGRWFACLPMSPWHPTPITPDYERDFPVFFLWSRDSIDDMRRREHLLECTPTRAVFATYTPSTGQTLLARAHTVHKVLECSKDQWKPFDELVDCAVAFTVQHQQRDGSEIEGDEDVDATLGQIIRWLRNRYTEEALTNLAKSVVPPVLDHFDTPFMSRLRICAGFIHYFLLVGEWYMVETSGTLEKTTWCID